MSYKEKSPIPVKEGGTGNITLAAHAILLGEGTSPISALSPGITGQGFMGVTGLDPTWTGSPSFSGLVTGGTGFTATTGDVTVTAGSIYLPVTTATTGIINSGGNRFIHRYGLNNTFIGDVAGNFTLTGTENTAVGPASLTFLTSGYYNTALGCGALNLLTSGYLNTSVGDISMSLLTTGISNTGIGKNVLNRLVSGSYNLALGTIVGYGAGEAYTTNESSNIVIGNLGTIGDNNTIRIGKTGAGNAQQNKCYLAATYGVNVGSVASVVSMSAGEQLGTTVITAGTNISVTPAANTITIAGTGLASFSWAVTTVNASLIAFNGYIANKAGLLTMTLPATGAIGDIIEITNMNTAVGWRIAQNAGQYIRYGALVTTPGVGGYIETTALGDSLKIICVVAGASTGWQAVTGSIGNLTVV